MKIKEVISLNEVADDLNEGKDFYDQKEPGVGDYFWGSIISDIESLYLYGGIHSKKFGCHRMLSKRFPYAIYYDLKGNVVTVIAVLPMRRDPAWIKRKLQRKY